MLKILHITVCVNTFNKHESQSYFIIMSKYF